MRREVSESDECDDDKLQLSGPVNGSPMSRFLSLRLIVPPTASDRTPTNRPEAEVASAEGSNEGHLRGGTGGGFSTQTSTPVSPLTARLLRYSCEQCPMVERSRKENAETPVLSQLSGSIPLWLKAAAAWKASNMRSTYNDHYDDDYDQPQQSTKNSWRTTRIPTTQNTY